MVTILAIYLLRADYPPFSSRLSVLIVTDIMKVEEEEGVALLRPY